MQCPVCQDTTLAMAERQGIEIDYCPECRGVWLDRGELDKIIERSVAETPSQTSTAAPHPSSSEKHGKHKHKKESLLAELFDF